MSPVDDFLGSLVGQQIPGGCDDCDAYQEVVQIAPGYYVCCICHDDWCPDLQVRERNAAPSQTPSAA